MLGHFNLTPIDLIIDSVKKEMVCSEISEKFLKGTLKHQQPSSPNFVVINKIGLELLHVLTPAYRICCLNAEVGHGTKSKLPYYLYPHTVAP